MPHRIQTYRLIVTLPDSSGEEADQVATLAESYLRQTQGSDITVTHALGQSPPEHLHVTLDSQGDIQIATAYGSYVNMTADQACQLAGVLLALADDAQETS